MCIKNVELYYIMSGGTLEYNNQNIVFNHNPNSFFYKSAQHNNELPSDLLELEKECKKNDYNIKTRKFSFWFFSFLKHTK